MNISIFGLGYVGFVTGICLAKNGHNVIGVDVNPAKVELVNDGTSPIVEEQIDEFMTEVHRNGRFKATTDAIEAILKTDVSLVCV